MSKILLVNNAEPGIKEFAEPIEKIISNMRIKTQFIEYAECLDYDFSAFDGVILTGSPQGDDIVEHHLPYFQWVKNYNKPVLGICAGHHIVGYMYGSDLLRSQEPESGDFEVVIYQNDPIFTDMDTPFIVKQMHNDSVTLPTDFRLLATSASCKNQLMKHRNKALYTCQFHPEFYNHDLIRNFVKIAIKKDQM